MIPFSFTYCRPSSLKEASEVYQQLRSEGKEPVYYSGGSEIITLCRAGSIKPDAVIDIKEIPECRKLSIDQNKLSIGAACTLTQIRSAEAFPLLGLACGRIADHSNQCRITLGGNLCGTIIYRESSLPLLLSDAEVSLFGPEGARSVPFSAVFPGKISLKTGEFLVGVSIPSWALTAPHVHSKHTANEKIDYPLVNVTALWKNDVLRVAFSGICSYPFRSEEVEAILNERTVPIQQRVDTAVTRIPDMPLTDVEGSGAYRLFILKNTLSTLLEDWEHAKI